LRDLRSVVVHSLTLRDNPVTAYTVAIADQHRQSTFKTRHGCRRKR
jgi:hypothetical protein